MADPSSPDDPYRSRGKDADTRRARDLDASLQVDPGLAEGRTRSGTGWIIAIAVAIVLGGVFYALNRSNVQNAGTAPPTQTSQTKPATTGPPPPNSGPGTTTGTATTRPPQSENAASDSDRAAKPADNNGAPPPAQNNDQR